MAVVRKFIAERIITYRNRNENPGNLLFTLFTHFFLKLLKKKDKKNNKMIKIFDI